MIFRAEVTITLVGQVRTMFGRLMAGGVRGLAMLGHIMNRHVPLELYLDLN